MRLVASTAGSSVVPPNTHASATHAIPISPTIVDGRSSNTMATPTAALT